MDEIAQRFASDVAEAKAGGRLFRTEHKLDGTKYVHYLNEDEIAEAQAATAVELAEAAKPVTVAEKLARIGLAIEDLREALRERP